MLIVYRGWGLGLAALGAVLLPVLFLVSGSLSIPLVVIAGLWIYFGRRRINKETGVAEPAPAVFFIPVWFYGALLTVPALAVLGVEVVKGRVVDWERAPANQQLADADVPGAADADRPPANAANEQPRADRRDPPPGQARQGDPEPASDSPTTADDAPTVAQPRPRRASHPTTSAPGQTVTGQTPLAPGQKLAAPWGSNWYQVVLVANDEEGLRIDWIGSRTYRDREVQRETLRLVSDEEFAACRQWGDDVITPPATPLADAPVAAGDRLLCEVSDRWLPVTVLSEADEGVQVAWNRFDDAEQIVSRERLYLTPTEYDRSTKHYEITIELPENYTRVTRGTPLVPGVECLAHWAQKWYPVDVEELRHDGGVVVHWKTYGNRSYAVTRETLIISNQTLASLSAASNDASPVDGNTPANE